jgi:PTH1 family peptidyl-tRNA hydrolase
MANNLIVCGLGNPGPGYRDTRHNLGFWVVDLLCDRFGGRWRHLCDRYLECRIKIGGTPLVLVEPLTYMNLSGTAVRLISDADREGFDPSGLLVVCDDTALPLGRQRLRAKGSDGGHNGLASIIEALGTERFPRLRLGVGPVPEGVEQADFVLTAFARDELDSARELAVRAADCVESWVREGVDAAMTRFNNSGGNGAPAGAGDDEGADGD